MKRSPFRRPVLERKRSVPTLGTGRGVMAASGDTAVSVPKDAPIRSEPYRRLVASLPCAECGGDGYSQAAHAEQGKGLAIKSCDLTCVPLCGPRFGIPGCHYAYGQGALYPRDTRRILERMNAAETTYKLRELAKCNKHVAKVLCDVGLLP